MFLPIFFLRNSKPTVILAVILGICSGAANIGLLAVINMGLTAGGPPKGMLIGLFVALCICVLVLEILSQLILIRLGQKAIYELRTQLCRQIFRLPLRRLEEIGPHRLLAVLTEDVVTVTNFIMFIPTLCISIVIVIGCLVYLSWLSWMVILMMFGFMIVGISSYQLLLKRAAVYMALAREQSDMLVKHFKTLTEGNKELKLHHSRSEAFFSDLLQAAAASFRRYNVLGMSVYAVAGSYGQILFLILIGLLVFGLSAFAQVELHVVTGCALTVLFMRGPLQTILNVLPNLGRANIALNKVQSLGLSMAESSEPPPVGPVEAQPAFERLELDGITHTYHSENGDSKFSLGPLGLTLHPGEFVFMSGGNGSGKTTLGKLLMGLYVPESGSIRLNGQLITDETRDYYRQHFSAVFSDFYLFESLLGLEGEGLDSRAESYLRLLQLDHKIQVRDGKLSTTELSQGQRKRLALLTAYLEDRPIYVFDEWAADQDPYFKDIFYRYLLPNLKARGKTLFVISHDDRYYHLADRVIKLEYGKIDKIEYTKETPIAHAQ